MIRAMARYAFLFVALLAIGPVVGWMVRSLRDTDGGTAHTLLVSGSPLLGLLIMLVSLVAAGVMAVVGTRVFSLGTGLLSGGFVFAWTGWWLGSVDAIIRRAGNGGSLVWLSVEAALAMAGACVLTLMATHAARANQPELVLTGDGVAVQDHRRLLVRACPDGAWAKPLALCGVVGAAAAGVAVTIVAVSMLKGQTLMACVIGGIAAGAAANWIAGVLGTVIQPATPVLAMSVVATVAPIAAMMMHGGGALDAAFSLSLLPIARPVSFDWAAGALIGVPIGMAWTGAVIDTRGVEAATA
ncbi:MAG: hypothetical protein KF864_07255 [Phycisphaeraceae bacterium]|nr:hypothetical protein [Phycisphaeraceae bacterium]